MKQEVAVQVANINFQFSADTQNHGEPNLIVETEQVEGLKATYLLRLSINMADKKPFILRDVSIEWSLPITDMHGLYFGGNPRTELGYLPFWQINKQTCVNRGVPYIALVNRNGENRAAFGIFDQLTETNMTGELSELTRCYKFCLQKPANNDSIGQTLYVEDCWQETFFVSLAQDQWSDVLKQYVKLSDKETQPELMPVPEQAYDPVFCTWTAIHHDVSHEWIMRNAGIAADLGFRNWITDDGWFIDKGMFSDYSKVGDWLPANKKFPDFKQHVKDIQNMGFRYILWVAPFMVGRDSEAAQQYAHLLTTGQERNHFNNLSPWHEETRQIVSDLLERLVSDYNLDGLKIDFIDSISMHGLRTEGAKSDTLGKSLFHILQATTGRLLSLNPQLLIEFRNSYTNLASRTYSNIYRSSDVPINFTLNRWQAVMLRLLTPDRAVQLDPGLWHPDDDDTNVAVHLINLLVSVPMISIELDLYPQTHLDLIRYWIGFYNAHRDTIIHGDFKPVLRASYIPAIYFCGSEESIIGVYDDLAISVDSSSPKTWILNASTQARIDLIPSSEIFQRRVICRDKFGNICSEEDMNFPLPYLKVEIGGSLEIIAI